MSSRAHVNHIIEWTPKALVGYEGTSNTTRTFNSVEDAATFCREAIVAVGRRTVFLRTLRVPNVSENEIRQILQLRLADLFPVAPQDLAIDFHLTDDVTAEGRLATIAAMPVIELARLYTDFRGAGIRVVRVVPSAHASTLHPSVNSAPTAIVQETLDGFAIDVLADHVLRQSRITNVANQLHSEVNRTFVMAGLDGGRIVSSGGLALPFADEATKDGSLELIYKNQDHLGFNLQLPEEVETRRRRDRARKQRLALLMMGAAAAVGMYVFFDYQDAVVKVRTKETEHNARMRKLKATESSLEAKLTETTALQAELDRAYRPPQPFSEVLTLFTQTPNGVWLTGITVERGKSLTVRGTATSNEAIASYLQRLSDQSAIGNVEQRLRDVRLVFANNATIEDTPVVQFSVSAFPIGNLPLSEKIERRNR